MNNKSLMNPWHMIVFISLLLSHLACDPLHKNKCEWYLMPDTDFRELLKPGWAGLCARNLTIKKEKCLFTAPIEFAESAFGKPFKLSDLNYKENGYLLEIVDVKLCDDSEKNTKK
jgi:hypothetical protein